ncbi:hypothetical protein B1T45_20095 [Mycobacterium kansasii]|uniref:Uncharacterized protein n=1 Tax=Mycobacterium kansasii ATCC 12478 TaxID=557599 RepID=U5WYE8_MYCKA|nr:hypothetical protein MKAN_09500 [Mycobacterium kansasii ATCC 12478]ARG57707.1 hypothetical protein B1T43_19680 [Mycobacterium kansasii]ARG63211.1 hypothetical protein B1T45_20095 [Mycobacterium kansasii]ARG70847.1 hypothetical protein B1T47_19420 [Mycobacterium kansasii]ARG74636.1 hypothetical protein B1T51_09275 [Mycobacterium kansasii]
MAGAPEGSVRCVTFELEGLSFSGGREAQPDREVPRFAVVIMADEEVIDALRGGVDREVPACELLPG